MNREAEYYQNPDGEPTRQNDEWLVDGNTSRSNESDLQYAPEGGYYPDSEIVSSNKQDDYLLAGLFVASIAVVLFILGFA